MGWERCPWDRLQLGIKDLRRLKGCSTATGNLNATSNFKRSSSSNLQARSQLVLWILQMQARSMLNLLRKFMCHNAVDQFIYWLAELPGLLFVGSHTIQVAKFTHPKS